MNKLKQVEAPVTFESSGGHVIRVHDVRQTGISKFWLRVSNVVQTSKGCYQPGAIHPVLFIYGKDDFVANGHKRFIHNLSLASAARERSAIRQGRAVPGAYL